MKNIAADKLKVGMLIQVKDRLIHPTAYRSEWMFEDAVITSIGSSGFVAEGRNGKIYLKKLNGAYVARPIQKYVDQDLSGYDPFRGTYNPVTAEDVEEIKKCWDWYYQRGLCSFG